MNDTEPGGSHIIVLQSYPGIAISFVIAIIFALIYALAVAYSNVLPAVDEDVLKEKSEDRSKTVTAVFGLLQSRRNFVHGMQTLKIFSLLFLAWTFSYSILALSQKLLPASLGALAFIITLISLLLVLILLMGFSQDILTLLARKNPEEFALRFYRPVGLLLALLRPISHLSLQISDKFLQRHQLNPEEQTVVLSEQELKEILEHNSDENDAEFLENVFAFGNKTVADCMTHRMDMVALPEDASLAELIEVIAEEKFTRIPVYAEDIDDIIGLVYARDVLLFAAKQPQSEFCLKDFLRETTYTPETQSIASLFRSMQEENLHMSIVIDEYGGTAGLITMEDVLEEIVGQIEDEYDEEEVEFQPLAPDKWLLHADLSLEDLEEYLDVEFPSEDYDTVAGFVIGLLDRIPHAEEEAEVRYGNYVFKVSEMSDKRIEKVLLSYLPLSKEAVTVEETLDVL